MSKISKVRKPNIVRGGIAIPLGRNYYYMSGRKHETGGIDIGKNPRTGLEVEDGEVMHIGNKHIEVFSAQPFLNGKSPAQRVLDGENPNVVFNAQERFKKRNKINDDGTKKKRIGGQVPNRKYTTHLTDSEEKEFQTWYSKVAKYKNLNPNPDAAGQDYDYRGYWKNEDREGILGSNPNAHFTDKYKQPTHPTFSNESIYSNNETPGGSWVKGKGTWLFKHNKYTARQADRTADYLNGTGEGFILGTDTIIPNKRKRMGRTNRINKYKAGGLYSVTINGETKLYQYPSTGKIELSKTTKATKRSKFAGGGNTKDKDKVKVITSNILPEVNPFTFTENPPTTAFTENVEATTNTNVPRAFAKRNRDITDPKKLSIAYQKESGTYPSWFQRTYKNIRNYVNKHPDTVNEGIGLASNVVSSFIGNSINRGMLNSLRYSSAPIPQRATKLKTRININPQLDRMRESLASYERAVDANTASSAVALARKQRARIANTLSTNEIYGDKENRETALINQDRLNQQEIANRNIDAYNTWAQGKTDFENNIRMQKAENNIALINNLNAGVQNVINNIQQRRTEGRNIRAMLLAYPDLPAEQLLASGIITQEEYNTYRKGYPLKRKTETNNNDNN